MKNDEEILERIDGLMKAKHLQHKDLIAYLGLARGTYTNWTRKTSTSFLSHLGEIAEFLGVSVAYLVTGGADSGAVPGMVTLSPQEEKVLACFRSVPERDRDLMLDLMAFLSERLQRKDSSVQE